MFRDCGKFGFIKQDDGEDMFVMPGACESFGGVLPTIGTQVLYHVVSDPKTGRPRAEDVRSAGSGVKVPPPGRRSGAGGSHVQDLAVQIMQAAAANGGGGAAGGAAGGGADTASLGPDEFAGTMGRTPNGTFGFIKQDDGTDMFVMPKGCVGFGGNLPANGTRVKYTVVNDPKTGRPRAEGVVPLGSGGAGGADAAAIAAALPQLSTHDLINLLENITPGAGAELASGLEGGGGAAPAAAPARPNFAWGGAEDGLSQQEDGGRQTGTFERHCGAGKFGFIKQDSNGQEQFVLPSACEYWNKTFPPVGTRVAFTVVPDERSGKTRAEEVTPEHVGGGAWGPAAKSPRIVPAQGPYGSSVRPPGQLKIPPLKGSGGGAIVGGGTQPSSVSTSRGGGSDWKPHWVQQKPSAAPAESWGGWGAGGGAEEDTTSWQADAMDESGSDAFFTGTISRLKNNFGFIQQDSGDADMFVIPGSCKAIGGELPPLGTRVRYRVTMDYKTGRPRAEDVSFAE